MNKKTDRIELLRPVQSVFIRFVGLPIGSRIARHVALQSSAHSRDSIIGKCCYREVCSVRLQSAPLGTRCKAKALPGGKEMFLFWNRGVDRKLYFKPVTKQKLSAGVSFEYELTTVIEGK